MTYEEVPELHFITPIENVPSILADGILCHRLAQAHDHASIAHEDVQQRRTRVRVPGGRWLHEYANLYFHARNPMMYRRKEQHAVLCVLSVRREVLHQEGVVVTDCNAASAYRRFAAGVEGLRIVDAARVYAEDWRHPDDEVAYRRHRAIKCAEVLVPERVVPSFVRGAYVSCEAGKAAVTPLVPPGFLVKVSPSLFFVE